MAGIIGSGNKQDKWTLRVTELLNWLNDNKQAILVAGDNITLTPQEDGTVKISAEGSGSSSGGGNVDDVLVDGTSVVANKVANIDLTGKQDKLPFDFVINASDSGIDIVYDDGT